MSRSDDYFYFENACGSSLALLHATQWHQAEMMFRLQDISTIYQLKESSEDEITKAVISLLQLVQLHKWRLQLVHHALDVSNDLDLSLTEFNQLWTMESLCGQLSESSLMRKEAELMFLQEEIEELETGLLEVMGSEDRKVTEAELAEKQMILEDLDQDVSEELALTFDPGVRRLTIVQFVAILNLGVAACYGSLRDSHAHGYTHMDVFKYMVVSFPILFALENLLMLWLHGLENVFVSNLHPAQRLARRMSLVVIIGALFGSVLLLADKDHTVMNANCQRALASCSSLLIITSGRHFSRMILSLSHAAATCAPIAFFVFDIVLLFAIASNDMFGDKVMDGDTGDPYFDTYTHSLSTMFRLFLGEG